MSHARTARRSNFDTGRSSSWRYDVDYYNAGDEREVVKDAWQESIINQDSEDTPNKELAMVKNIDAVASFWGVVPVPFVVYGIVSASFLAVFLTLLVLDVALGIATVHPFVSLIGILGSLGWLLTAYVSIAHWTNK